jgi:hypothetical protein
VRDQATPLRDVDLNFTFSTRLDLSRKKHRGQVAPGKYPVAVTAGCGGRGFHPAGGVMRGLRLVSSSVIEA